MSKPLNGAASDTSLLALAEDVLKKTEEIVAYLRANNLPEPTFSADSPLTPETAEYTALYGGLTNSLEDLQRLAQGPRKLLQSVSLLGFELTAFQIALEFDFFTIVVPGREISVHELAEKAGLDLDRTRRTVGMLMTHRFFQMTRPDWISHTSHSIVLYQDVEIRSAVHFCLDEMLKAAADSNVSLKSAPHESDSEHCPFKTRHGLSIFKYYTHHPELAGRFARAMAGITKMGRDANQLKDCFPWDRLNGTVVDVGGGSGHVSMMLAELFPRLSFVVQDESAPMLAEGETLLNDGIRDRISFARHNFFTPQPYRGAAAFLMRQICHDWCDRDVVTILKSIVPGLEGSDPNTPLLINDNVMPQPGDWPRHAERAVRDLDMIMMVSFGSKERTKEEFEALLKEADSRYEIRNVHAAGPMSLLEVYLKR
ncbi:putative O-methyltransferase [Rosellinia necatrix]|uniref:Putative O-methyltransferase n=1 Tax=Rosellinia necatrix TaxID=77044 RepID=A0A1W2TBA6_ROSNE|nr:putative O-methyltransferase [Rosellinia necatrix]